MSELTTDKALRFIADGLCDCMGTLEEHHTNGCPQDEVAVAWLAQVRREAKIEALREAADAALAVREAHCKIWPWPGSPEWSEAAHEYELTRVAFEQLRESPWGWIMDRADRMEGENK